jgi:cell division protein FtsB
VARRPRLTGRAALLALVLVALVAALAYPTRQFIAQRSEIAAQRSAAQKAQASVDELQRQKARWQDPAYVEAQARARLHFGFPGETLYSSVDPAAAAAVGASPQPQAAGQPWYRSLFDSIDAADTAGH